MAATIFLQMQDSVGYMIHNYSTYTEKEKYCHLTYDILMIESCILISEILKSKKKKKVLLRTGKVLYTLGAVLGTVNLGLQTI